MKHTTADLQRIAAEILADFADTPYPKVTLYEVFKQIEARELVRADEFKVMAMILATMEVKP